MRRDTTRTDANLASTCLYALARDLLDREFRVQVDGRRGIIRATNAATAETDDPYGRAINPGLTQEVALCRHADESLHWYWVWPGPRESNSPPTTEYLCSGRDLDMAAAKITTVLALRT